MARLRRIEAPLIVVGSALLLWLWSGAAIANYDTLYALVWGGELVHGNAPDYSAVLAPTPHPLATLLGFLLSPFGAEGAEQIAIAICFLAFGCAVYFVFAIGRSTFGVAIGVLAAAVVATRQPVVLNTLTAYIDMPYLAFVLAALALELRRARAGWPVLLLLALAGLLRPEAWLFSAAYLAWLFYGAGLATRKRIGLAALAASAPLLWLLFDLVITGQPFFSFTHTRSGAETLQRVTGLENVPYYVPRRLGEILREPVIAGALAGGLMSLALLRDRALKLAICGLVSVVAFTVLAASGLPINTRYLLLPGAILAVFFAVCILGWRLLEKSERWRTPWIVLAAVVTVASVAFIPSQVSRLNSLRGSVQTQREIRDDLVALLDQTDLPANCGPLIVPNQRPIPLLALALNRRPSAIQSAQQNSQPEHGIYLDPANADVERNFILDPRDKRDLSAEVPTGFVQRATNRSWRLFTRCS